MILTGPEIERGVSDGRITIEPFDPRAVEPNSYGFRLGSTLLTYADDVLDARLAPDSVEEEIPSWGYVLTPGRCYLGETLERIGSEHYAATLYARRSVSTLGMWIQFSAPLGHTGAIIPWTLEITVAHPMRVYSGMTIGKIAFWAPLGHVVHYHGRYEGSEGVVPSRFAEPAAVEATVP